MMAFRAMTRRYEFFSAILTGTLLHYSVKAYREVEHLSYRTALIEQRQAYLLSLFNVREGSEPPPIKEQ